MANLEGDVWLTGGRWVADLEGDVWLTGGRWVADLEGDGWLSFVAHLLATAALWFEYRHSQKLQNGRHKAKEWPTHSCPQKNICIYGSTTPA